MSAWVTGFQLRTARIVQRHSFGGPKLSLVVGEYLTEEQKSRGHTDFGKFSIELSFNDAAKLMCTELADADKSFYIHDLTVCEVPKAQADWARYGQITHGHSGFRYDIFETRDEAKAALREMLQKRIDDLEKQDA